MRAAKLQELEVTAEKLLVIARKLPPGQDRHNALREIGRFRARITALQGADLESADLESADLRPARRGLKAKGK
jgi:uncharacterized protein YjbI with pentapeptide repeats